MAMPTEELRDIFNNAFKRGVTSDQRALSMVEREDAALRAVETATLDRAIATVTRTIQGGTDPMLTVGAYIVKALEDMKEGNRG